jgi:hypothetical protein
MNRSQAISTIEGLYGTDGTIAWKVISAVVAEMGVDAFRDDALKRIAEMQQKEHDAHYGS